MRLVTQDLSTPGAFLLTRLLSSYIQKWNVPEEKKVRAPLKWYSDVKPRLRS